MSAEGMGLRTGRMLPALRAFANGSALTWKDLQAQFGWETKQAQKTVDNCLGRRLLERTGEKMDGVIQVQVTPLGMQYIGNMDPQADPLPHIAEQALELIEPSSMGLDSATLGEMLGVPATTVERALAPHVEAMRLVHCHVTKTDGRFVQYRMSAGGASSIAIWRATQAEKSRPAPTMRAAPAPAPLAAPFAAPAAAPMAAEAREPGPVESAFGKIFDSLKASAAGGEADDAAAAEETAHHRVEISGKTFFEALQELDLPPATPPPDAPYIGELDPDAVDRKAAAAAGREDPATAFSCALWSTGALVINSQGTRLTLPVEHTRKLLHYLQHMQADELVATGARA